MRSLEALALASIFACCRVLFRRDRERPRWLAYVKKALLTARSMRFASLQG